MLLWLTAISYLQSLSVNHTEGKLLLCSLLVFRLEILSPQPVVQKLLDLSKHQTHPSKDRHRPQASRILTSNNLEETLHPRRDSRVSGSYADGLEALQGVCLSDPLLGRVSN